MPAGWSCEHCGTFHLDVHVVTKIVVSIEPRDYAAEITLCSFRCLDEYRDQIDDAVAWAQEHDGTKGPRLRQRVIEEWVPESNRTEP